MDTSLTVNAADYAELKSSFVAWLKTQPQFADYELDRPGDTMNTLLGLLAFNTYQNLFYHNMAVGETFLDTAQLRDSGVSRAKELNYVPRSFRSAVAIVNISVTSTNLSRSSIVLPKGTLFTSRIGDRSYSFTTDRSYISTESEVNGGTITFTFNDVELHEGFYLTETIPYEEDTPFVIPNEQVDVSSINVVVLEDNGGATIPYSLATNLFGLDEESKVFFVQGSPGSKYEIIFGDGSFGRKPKANSLITIDYRISNGELPNGAREFKAGESIDGETQIAIETITPAHAGTVFESLASIKLNAPRHFASQGNAVTGIDYGSLLKQAFPEIVDVSAYGGEDANPPQFGRVLISVVLNGIDYVPTSKRNQFYDFLRQRSLMKPVFVEPTFIYAEVTSRVEYDLRRTTLNPDDIRTLVLNAIMNYNTNSLNKFDSVLRSSRLGADIDNAHSSIKSNDTSIRLVRELTNKDWLQGAFTVDFGSPLTSLTSSSFLLNNVSVSMQDVGGEIVLVSDANGLVVRPVGTIDYATGLVTMGTLSPDDETAITKLFVVPASKDIGSSLNTILKIRESDTLITVAKS